MIIICTKEEKQRLVAAIMASYPCIIHPEGCEEDAQQCYQCIDKNIKWTIQDPVVRPPFKKNCARCNWVEDFGNKCICQNSVYYGEEVLKMGVPIHEPCDQWKTLED